MRAFTKEDLEKLVYTDKVKDLDTSEYPYITMTYDDFTEETVEMWGDDFTDEDVNNLFKYLEKHA